METPKFSTENPSENRKKFLEKLGVSFEATPDGQVDFDTFTGIVDAVIENKDLKNIGLEGVTELVLVREGADRVSKFSRLQLVDLSRERNSPDYNLFTVIPTIQENTPSDPDEGATPLTALLDKHTAPFSDETSEKHYFERFQKRHGKEAVVSQADNTLYAIINLC